MATSTSSFSLFILDQEHSGVALNASMDPTALILSNIRNVLGCNGIQNFYRFSELRLQTLEKRMNLSESKKLSPRSKASIGAVWLLENATRLQPHQRLAVIEGWLQLLFNLGCSYNIIMEVWKSNMKNRARLVKESSQFQSKAKEMTLDIERLITEYINTKKPFPSLQKSTAGKAPRAVASKSTLSAGSNRALATTTSNIQEGPVGLGQVEIVTGLDGGGAGDHHDAATGGPVGPTFRLLRMDIGQMVNSNTAEAPTVVANKSFIESCAAAEKLLSDLVVAQIPRQEIGTSGESISASTYIGLPTSTEQTATERADGTPPGRNNTSSGTVFNHSYHPMAFSLRLGEHVNYPTQIRLTALDFWGSQDGGCDGAERPNDTQDK